MAVAGAHLTTGANATNGASYDSASVTPTGDALVLLWVSGTGTNSQTAPTITGNGLTWVLVVSASQASIFNGHLFRAMGATPSAGVVNISWTAGNVTGCNWSLAEFTGVDTGGTNGSAAVVQSKAGSGSSVSSLTVTLDTAPTAGNGTAGGFAIDSQLEDITPGSGFTELGEAAHSNPATEIFSEWRADTDQTIDATWLLIQACWGIGAEIKVAAAGGVTGTLATTLAGVTLSASGTETITGTLATTLAGATLAASGTETISGTLAATLDGATLAASGTETITGTLASTLDGATLSASGSGGDSGVTGTLATTLDGATLAASGTETVTGTLASTLEGAALAGSGTETFTGTLSAALAGTTLAATGTETVTGTLASTLVGVTLAAQGTETITGALTVTLAGATLLAVSTETPAATPAERVLTVAAASRVTTISASSRTLTVPAESRTTGA
jgi:hypothetical protein